MSAERITLDTNILIYAIDRDAGERHQKARALIHDVAYQDCVLTLQALSEFVAVATRKGKLSVADARAYVQDWRLLFPTVLPNLDNVDPSDRRYRATQAGFLGRHALGDGKTSWCNALAERGFSTWSRTGRGSVP